VELIILLIVAGVVMVIIMGGTYLTCQRVQDYCSLETKREELVERVLNSRLGKMLRRLNISLGAYLGRFPATAITRHISTCQQCDAINACDSYLAGDGRGTVNARDFCPNLREFDRLRDGAH
jgi:hypothetical protein